ncbi:hypothetical protein Trydic_g18520 [Trypoxylus dichotomus]
MATGEPPRSRSDLARTSLEEKGVMMIEGEIDQYQSNSLTPSPKLESSTKQKVKKEQELTDSWRKTEREIEAPLPEDERPPINFDQNLVAPTRAGQERVTRKREPIRG